MRWFEGKRAFLLAPMMVVMCGDSLAPGGCGGKPAPAQETGTFACTMTLEGRALPCAGTWTYEKDAHHYWFSLYGGDRNQPPAATIRLQVWTDTSPADVAVGSPWLSADAHVNGACWAADTTSGATGAIHLSTLKPPTGTFGGTLVGTNAF